MVFPSNAIAAFPFARVSPIIPDPITVAKSIVVPVNSDKYARIFILNYPTYIIDIFLKRV